MGYRDITWTRNTLQNARHGRVCPPAFKTYAESSNEERSKMERDGVIANVLQRNQRRVCEERGIPPEVFRRIWEEYRESNTFQGNFFHREEIVQRETKDSTQRMQSALVAHPHREHEANGTFMFFTTIIILLHVTLSLLLTMLETVPGEETKVCRRLDYTHMETVWCSESKFLQSQGLGGFTSRAEMEWE